jgi:AmmeMemoRadiSam system protein A
MTDSPLNTEQRRALLAYARQVVMAHAGGARRLPEPPSDEGLDRLAGAFVSLHRRGRLRGCIGTFSADRPLGEVVREMAVAASSDDPRFAPVKPEEVGELEVEVSVLTPRRIIKDVNEIRVGEHGLVVSRGGWRGVLLPQVATNFGWDRQTFLEETCLKAGLERDAWQDPRTVLEVFSAQVFGEGEGE